MAHAPKDAFKTATDARQGETTGVVRWVLGVSLPLAVLALIAVCYFST
jgi:hypothetical protein